MVSRFVFELDSTTYTTKTSAQEAARLVLNSQPMHHQFESVLLSDLVSGYHYYCAPNSLRPSKFRKTPHKMSSYRLEGWFEGIGWHGVSYLKCLTPPTFKRSAKEALRRAVRPIISAHKKDHCETCGDVDRLEVDHVTPKFVEMAEEALAAADDADKAAWENFDWVRQEDFLLPEDGAAVAKILELHHDAVLRTVCAPCHRNVAR